MIAIYSLTSWRSSAQTIPKVTLDSEWGGRVFDLACKNINWVAEGGPQGDGALFDCFREMVLQPEIAEPGEVLAPLVSENEDLWYEFQWDSLFGYQYDVIVNPERSSELYKVRDGLRKDRACEREASRELCSFSTYVVQIRGLTSSDRVAFVAASGHPVRLSNGSVDRRDGWTVTLGGQESSAMTIGDINKAIQLTARTLGFEETDLAKIAPKLETIWMKKDKAFLTTLFSELAKLPELSTVARFLKAS